MAGFCLSGFIFSLSRARSSKQDFFCWRFGREGTWDATGARKSGLPWITNWFVRGRIGCCGILSIPRCSACSWERRSLPARFMRSSGWRYWWSLIYEKRGWKIRSWPRLLALTIMLTAVTRGRWCLCCSNRSARSATDLCSAVPRFGR